MGKKTLVAPQASDGKQLTEIDDAPDAPRPPADEDSPEHQRRLRRVEERARLVTLSDQVAGDVFFFRNYKWDSARKHYPDDLDALMRFVSKYYPNSMDEERKHETGALYVDEPRNQREYQACLEKQKILHGMGLRHIVVRPEMPGKVKKKEFVADENGIAVQVERQELVDGTVPGSTLDELWAQLEAVRVPRKAVKPGQVAQKGA